nr:uncharacterized protein LOC112769804 [Arachis hypogaea]
MDLLRHTPSNGSSPSHPFQWIFSVTLSFVPPPPPPPPLLPLFDRSSEFSSSSAAALPPPLASHDLSLSSLASHEPPPCCCLRFNFSVPILVSITCWYLETDVRSRYSGMISSLVEKPKQLFMKDIRMLPKYIVTTTLRLVSN